MVDTEVLQVVRRFKKEYYEQMDIDRLSHKLDRLTSRLDRIKDHKKLTSDMMDLYYLYLQTIETLFINVYTFCKKDRDFPIAIFI